ncbi:DUF4129 domain-containing protein [Mycolicibacterium goodii]|uniref:DUF4129 domain-containing protein n=1 Tax=Mycolicibacterium goodii TaxID=134601 RepID=UPI00296FFCA7
MATVLVLMVTAGIALRGYLPGGGRAPAETHTDSPATLVAVIALLAVGLAGFAFAILTAPRKARRPGAADDIGGAALGGLRMRLQWRWVLLGLAVLICWLSVAVLLTRLTDPSEVPPPDRGATPDTTGAPGEPAAPPAADNSAFRVLAVAGVIMLLLIATGTVLRARQRAAAYLHRVGDGPFEPVRPRNSETLARATELGLAEIGDLSRDPRTAIIACYAAMEEGLARAPGAAPQDSDTPSEVLARAVAHHALNAEGATELVELFAEARFSRHRMTETHRASAVAALRRVHADLRSPV